MLIDAEYLRRFGCCYDEKFGPEYLDKLFPVPRTLLEVLTLQDGDWSEVPAIDRYWVATRTGLLSRELLIQWVYRIAYRNTTIINMASGKPLVSDKRILDLLPAILSDSLTNELIQDATDACRPMYERRFSPGYIIGSSWSCNEILKLAIAIFNRQQTESCLSSHVVVKGDSMIAKVRLEILVRLLAETGSCEPQGGSK